MLVVYMHLYLSLLRDSSNNNPIAKSTPRIQFLVSKCHYSVKRTDSRLGSCNVPDKPERPFSIRKQKSAEKIEESLSKEEHRSRIERATNGQSQNHFSSKINSVVLA